MNKRDRKKQLASALATRWKNTDKEKRRKIASELAKKRWAKHREKLSTHTH